jgi:hypothetical protein
MSTFLPIEVLDFMVIEVFIWGEGEGNKAIPGPSTTQGQKKASSKPVKHVYI